MQGHGKGKRQKWRDLGLVEMVEREMGLGRYRKGQKMEKIRRCRMREMKNNHETC